MGNALEDRSNMNKYRSPEKYSTIASLSEACRLLLSVVIASICSVFMQAATATSSGKSQISAVVAVGLGFTVNNATN